MPLRIDVYDEGTAHTSPFVGPVDHTLHLRIDISGLTTAEVDADGYLKAGVPFQADGTLIGDGDTLFGVTVEPVKLPLETVPPTDATLDTETGDCDVAVATHGILNRDIGEDLLGRAYTAFELAAFAAAGSHIRITQT